MSDPKEDALFGDGSPPIEQSTEEATSDVGRPILTKKEIEAARQVARDRVEKAMKDAEVERIVREEMEALRREEGLRTGKADMDEEITFHVDLAEFADRLRINGEEFFHGYSYTKPRHVYESLREIMFRGHVHQAALDGKDLATFYGHQRAPTLSGKVGA